MASRGNARVQLRWSPSLVPGTRGDEVFVEDSGVWVLEAANRAARVEDGGVVDQVLVPFPRSCRWLFRGVGAVDSCRKIELIVLIDFQSLTLKTNWPFLGLIPRAVLQTGNVELW